MPRPKIKDRSLYLIITEEYCRGRSALEVAQAAIAGRVDAIQLREKNRSRAEIAKQAAELAVLCKKNRVLFIINDDPILAKMAGADGVHLGQEDLKCTTVSETRKILGKDKIIGISTSLLSELEAANNEDIDYVAFGPVFPTVVKELCVGTKDVKKAAGISKKKIFFIGGINLSNMDALIKKGGKNIALIRAVTEADDVAIAIKELKKKLNKA